MWECAGSLDAYNMHRLAGKPTLRICRPTWILLSVWGARDTSLERSGWIVSPVLSYPPCATGSLRRDTSLSPFRGVSLVTIAYVSNISAYFTILILRASILY